jgi:hypothetical protein
MSRFTKDVAVLALVAAADHSTKRGFLCKITAGQAAVHDSATAEPFGIILDGEKAGGMDSVGVLGGNLGTVKVKLGGNITAIGTRLVAKADGTVEADDAAGARVVVGKALETGVTDELIEAVLFEPTVFAA